MNDPLEGNSEYRFLRFLGEGSFGLVVQAKHNDETVAIKLIPITPKLDMTRVSREILNHRSLCHHHVIRFHRLILTSKYLGIVMDYAEGGTLRDYIAKRGPLSENLVRFLFQQLVLGIEYCHKMNIVNRDIKIQNTLLTGNANWPMLKICDFGYSKHALADSVPDSLVGTEQMAPPEVLFKKPKEKYDGVKADVWCMGMFLYCIAANRYPFYNGNEKISTVELAVRIRNVQYQIPEGLSKDCADLIQQILQQRPEDRPTLEEIKNHPYFRTNLPKGAEDMNEKCRRQRLSQSVAEIQDILKRAQHMEEM